MIQAIKGTYDILPGDVAIWHAVEARLRAVFHSYGFGEIRTPIFEATELFVRGVGEETDIVSKEMYTFTDRDESKSLTLRPEGTAACVRAVKERNIAAQVEVLVPDFHARPDLIRAVADSGPNVYNHNVETVRRLSRSVRPQAGYDRSLQVLRLARRVGRPGMKSKSGLMVGLGESPSEVREAMEDLRKAGCEILTVGQYLRPTAAHRPVAEFVPPEQFEQYRRWGEELGFSFVASGPYVRSSYNAFEVFENA